MSNKRQIRRRRSGKGRFGCVYTLLVTLVLLIVFSLSVSLFFKTKTIVVEGSVSYTEPEVVEASGLKTGENIFFINKFDAISKIFEKMPIIEKIQIKRKLPGTVVILITEERTLGVIKHEGFYWKFNPKGKLLASVVALPGVEYPIVEGVSLIEPHAGDLMAFPQAEIEKRTALLEVLDTLSQKEMLDDVKTINVANLSNISFMYKDSFEVFLGMPVDVDYKLSFLKAAVEKVDASLNWNVDLSRAKDKKIGITPKS